MSSWTLHLVARSSITHGGDTRGTVTMLRRETIVQPDGQRVQVPVISGNALRGRLRRVGEELMRDALGYEGQLSPAAAHVLRGGGALVKAAGEPLSGRRLQEIRALVPQLSVFGGGAGGAIIDGALSVGKVVPHLIETEHITGYPGQASAFSAVQLEMYTRADDSLSHDFAPVPTSPATGAREQQMQYQLETLPAGTRFTSWAALRRPTELETSFFTSVLAAFAESAALGGRTAAGHGQVSLEIDPPLASAAKPGWRAFVLDHRAAVMEAISALG